MDLVFAPIMLNYISDDVLSLLCIGEPDLKVEIEKQLNSYCREELAA